MRRPSINRLALGLGIAFLASAMLVGGLAAYVLYRGYRERPASADAVVVLGAAVWPGGRPSPALYARTARGVQLVQQGYAPRLIPTGGVGRNPPAEAEVIHEIARSLGLPEDAIVVEPTATSTQESAERVGALMAARGWRRAILVSDPFHLLRARVLFQDCGLVVSAAPTDDRYYTTTTRLSLALREAVAILAYLPERTVGRGACHHP